MRWLMARSIALIVDVELGELGTDAVAMVSVTTLVLAAAVGVAFVLFAGFSAVTGSIKFKQNRLFSAHKFYFSNWLAAKFTFRFGCFLQISHYRWLRC